MTDVPGVGDSRSIVDRDGRRYAFADHRCFACGDVNPIGMRLRIPVGIPIEARAEVDYRRRGQFNDVLLALLLGVAFDFDQR